MDRGRSRKRTVTKRATRSQRKVSRFFTTSFQYNFAGKEYMSKRKMDNELILLIRLSKPLTVSGTEIYNMILKKK